MHDIGDTIEDSVEELGWGFRQYEKPSEYSEV